MFKKLTNLSDELIADMIYGRFSVTHDVDGFHLWVGEVYAGPIEFSEGIDSDAKEGV